MKATNRDFARIAARAAENAKIFFFCGADESGMYQAADRIAALLPDAGERVELSGAELRRDPVRLGDEARSSSLFGGSSRYILIRAQGDDSHDAIKNLLDSEIAPCPVIVIASSATDKSRTAKLLINRSDALVAIFYPPDLATVTGTVRSMADTMGLRIDRETAHHIANASSLDLRLAEQELIKLALYLDASPQRPRDVDKEALNALLAGVENDSFTPLVNVVLGGKKTSLAHELNRASELGLNPVGVLLAIERRAAQLALLAAQAGRHGNIDAIIRAEVNARRIFRSDQAAVTHQLRCWSPQLIEKLIIRLADMHRQMLSDSRSAALILAHGLTAITRVASRKASANRPEV